MMNTISEAMTSWVEVAKESDFPIQNIPFGVYESAAGEPHLCTAIGDQVVDLFMLAEGGLFSNVGIDASVFNRPFLNDFIGLEKEKTNAVRARIAELLSAGNNELQGTDLASKALMPISSAKMKMPVHVTDYTDFYSSIEHATNVGTMFRGKENALMPNWKHIPVGYHGRASSIVVSGTNVVRPKGQMLPQDADTPVFGPSRLLDFELEMGFIVGRNTSLGDSVKVTEAEDYIFGLVLFNDWSARDIQKWEYVPLGPFLGKNFASSISPWIVTLEALEPFRVAGPEQDPQPLPYLQVDGSRNYDINLNVFIKPEGGEDVKISGSNFKYMYWNMCQQLAHHTVNGCNINIGDLYASGTISGPTEDSYGSMLELTWRGSKPIAMPDGSERKFIQDGDTLIIRGFAEKDGLRIGFGEVSGKVLPATN